MSRRVDERMSREFVVRCYTLLKIAGAAGGGNEETCGGYAEENT
jgi:hypothetical protein